MTIVESPDESAEFLYYVYQGDRIIAGFDDYSIAKVFCDHFYQK